MGGLRSILSSFFFLAVLTQPSVAQRFPAKPITMVVPYAPGGNVDVTARVLQAAIGDALGQPVVIENRPGGAGLIAGDYVARAIPMATRCWSDRTGRSFSARSPWPSQPTSGSRHSRP